MEENSKDISTEFKAIWGKYNPFTDQKGVYLFGTLENNRKECQRKYLKSYYILLILGLTFYFIDSNLVNEIEIFSIKITNLVVLKWIMCPVFCYIFYQGLTSFVEENLLRNIINIAIADHLEELNENFLNDLLYSPSMVAFERFQVNKHESKISDFFWHLVILSFIIVPFLLIGYIVYENILDWNLINSEIFRYVIIFISSIFSFRTILLVISIFTSNNK